jgi:hypothetical protein
MYTILYIIGKSEVYYTYILIIISVRAKALVC